MSQRAHKTFFISFVTAATVISVLPISLADKGDPDDAAHEEVMGDADEVEEIEELGELEEIKTNQGPPSLKEYFGRTHPMLVHFPIAWMVLWLLLEVVILLFGAVALEPAIRWVGMLAILSFIPGIVTGLVRADFSVQDAEVLHEIEEHRNLIFISGALGVAALAWRLAFTPQGKLRTLFVVFLAIVVLVLSLGGHHGGMLVYGEDYLPFGDFL